MCISKKRVYNKWSKTWLWVDCGHCSACQQAKANKRLRRIKNASQFGYVPLFVTLTYANCFIPYIDIVDIKSNAEYLPIRRDSDVRRVRVPGMRYGSRYNMAYRFKGTPKVLNIIDCFERKVFVDDKQFIPRCNGDPGKVGVIYYKDIQNFEKRLAINLKRRFGIFKPYKVFKCAEYGAGAETHFRPHFHLLIYVPQEDLAAFDCAIREAWPYDFKSANKRKVEIARNASSYVSAYVNRGSDFPEFLENKPFRPKHSFSKGFGLVNPQFTLSSLLESIDRGDLCYIGETRRNGFPEYTTIQYPKYFINRYFFKFKGYSRLNDNQVSDLIRRPLQIYRYGQSLGYVDEDFDKFLSVLRLRYNRFCRDLGYTLPHEDSLMMFADYFVRCFRVQASQAYIHMFDEVTSPRSMLECYENLDEVRGKGIKTDLFPLTASKFS